MKPYVLDPPQDFSGGRKPVKTQCFGDPKTFQEAEKCENKHMDLESPRPLKKYKTPVNTQAFGTPRDFHEAENL